MMSFEPLDLTIPEAHKWSNKFFFSPMLVRVGFLSLNIKTTTITTKTLQRYFPQQKGQQSWVILFGHCLLPASITACGDVFFDPNSSSQGTMSLPLFIFHFCSQWRSHWAGITATTTHSLYMQFMNPSSSLPSVAVCAWLSNKRHYQSLSETEKCLKEELLFKFQKQHEIFWIMWLIINSVIRLTPVFGFL